MNPFCTYMHDNLAPFITGDNVIGFDAKNRTWTRAQDVRVNITYPAAGVVGRKLTFIGIEVNQVKICTN